MLTRRLAILGALFTPSIIRTPGLIMPLGSSLTRLTDTIEIFAHSGASVVIPVIDGAAKLTVDERVLLSQSGVFRSATRAALPLIVSLGMDGPLTLYPGDTLSVSTRSLYAAVV